MKPGSDQRSGGGRSFQYGLPLRSSLDLAGLFCSGIDLACSIEVALFAILAFE